MNALDVWLAQATRHLSKDSAAQVRAEIQSHYESAREAAMADGATEDDAHRLALSALGNAKTANYQYRKVLLTSAEARMLRNGNREARAVCSRPWVKRMLLAIPFSALLASIFLFLSGAPSLARVLLIAGTGKGVLFAMPFLPIYTASRSRVFRGVKWFALGGVLALTFGHDALKWSWLLFSCLWPMAWSEWVRMSIRRKLPVIKWPKHLYL